MESNSKQLSSFWFFETNTFEFSYKFSRLGIIKMLEESEIFLKKYISLNIKYGFNLPKEVLSDMNLPSIVEKVVFNVLESLDKGNLLLSYSKLIKGFYLFPADKNGNYEDERYSHIFSDDSEGKVYRKLIRDYYDVFSLFANYDSNNTSNFCLIYWINTNLFNNVFYEKKPFLDEYTYEDKLSILNTTRLNSYIRDLTYLFFEYGAIDFSFQPLVENLNDKYLIYAKQFFKVRDKVLFYEDVYYILPEAHRLKSFEEIQVDLDDTNYKKYMAKV